MFETEVKKGRLCLESCSTAGISARRRRDFRTQQRSVNPEVFTPDILCCFYTAMARTSGQNCFSKKADVEHKKIIDGFKSMWFLWGLALATCAATCRTLVCATPLHHVCEICLRHWQDHARETFYSHVFA